MVDILNGVRAVLLTYFSKLLGMSNATLGLVSTIYILSASLFQPVFGYLADRFGSRWVIVGGVFWMAAFFALALLLPGPLALVLLVLASLGSGAYHPAGVKQTTLIGRSLLAGQETTATSYFFLFGQTGSFLGPILGGPLLDHFGPVGLLVLALPAIPVSLYANYHLRSALPDPPSALQNSVSPSATGKLSRLALVAFVLLAAFQSWAAQNMSTFVPKYLSDLGQSASIYGLITALFLGSYALGNVAGGMLADKLGNRRIAFISLFLASAPVYLLPEVGMTLWIYLIAILAGAFIGATQSIIVVYAQRLVPGGMALATGLILGFMFSCGAIGTYWSGFMADWWGFRTVFHLTGLIALVGGFFALSMKETRD